jgi:hypothetical protein
MSPFDRKRIRVDWEELEDAFADASTDHRYYLDRETGAVHFFSSYLDNEEEAEDEQAITSEERYVQIPHAQRVVQLSEILEFVGRIEEDRAQKRLRAILERHGGSRGFEEALEELPAARREWREFTEARRDARIKEWLYEVGIEPL